ncbi:MAG: T9SS type A sorting domain-containing protein [Ignavibacteriae bacterium]|nr:T9SS type A sorting domain-containing protein [Ignavibacteriota bacterium]
MKQMLLTFLLVVLVAGSSNAQWQCLYATYDDDACPSNNATGHNTFGVGVIKQNMFVALVMTRLTDPSQAATRRCFMIPYVNADSTTGRRYTYGYQSQTNGIYQVWTDGAFDQIQMCNAFSIVATPDSFIYVANNNNPAISSDAEHNILVFKYANDTIKVVPPYSRTSTSLNGVYGIAVDGSKRVYISHDTTTNQAEDIKIYAPASTWGSSHVETPLRTIDLPNGIYKGLTVTPDGAHIFISSFSQRRVLKYSGSVATGYTLNGAFSFQVTDTIPGSTGSLVRPLGLAYLSPNNILAVACDSLFGGSTAYNYGRVYLVNPNTGALISPDTSLNRIDAAWWNFSVTGGYNLRSCGHGNLSGYASLYDVKFDEAGNVYTQSNYGWTVDKWKYNGTLPTINSVEEVGGALPQEYILKQNYPNPFNPTTTIEFSVLKSGHISLKVYDVLGKEVATLVDEEREPGNFKVTFDASTLTSGTYFYTLRSGGFAETKKMLIVR